MLEFKVNNFIILKLEKSQTNIYVNGELFNQCKYILMRKTFYEFEEFFYEIESVDELAERLDGSLEGIEPEFIDIPPETRFWVHCSNMQAWAENNYNTDLIHSNLAFPLLAKLNLLGDPIAKKVFKKEIIRKLSSGYFPTILGLISAGYTTILELNEDILYEDYEKSFVEMKKKLSKEELERIIEEEAEKSAGGGYLGNYEKVNKKYSLNTIDLEIIKEIEHLIEVIIPYNSDHSMNGPFIFIEENKVKILALDHLGLTHVPDCVGLLGNLERLRLGDNKLKKIPNSIGNLKNLRTLSLSRNLIKDLPDSIKNLENLERLILWENHLFEIPSNVYSLKNLKDLSLGKNQFNKIPNNIVLLKNLEYLSLSYNNITEIPEFLTQLNSLKELHIDGNPLKKVSKSILKIRPLKLIIIDKEKKKLIKKSMENIEILTVK